MEHIGEAIVVAFIALPIIGFIIGFAVGLGCGAWWF